MRSRGERAHRDPRGLEGRAHRPRVPHRLRACDLNLQITAAQKAKVTSFFIACREVVNTVKDLCLRAAVRPSVWTIIKLGFEALSHVEQFADAPQWWEDASRQCWPGSLEHTRSATTLGATVILRLSAPCSEASTSHFDLGEYASNPGGGLCSTPD